MYTRVDFMISGKDPVLNAFFIAHMSKRIIVPKDSNWGLWVVGVQGSWLKA